MSYIVRYCNAVETDPKDLLEVRLKANFIELERACRFTGARVICIEIQDSAQIGQTAEGRGSANLLHVQKSVGVALGVAYAYGYQVIWCYPSGAKIALLGAGQGAASKKDVKEACLRLFKFDRGTRLVVHSADAVAIALKGHHLLMNKFDKVCGYDPGLNCGIAVLERAA